MVVVVRERVDGVAGPDGGGAEAVLRVVVGIRGDGGRFEVERMRDIMADLVAIGRVEGSSGRRALSK